MKKWRCLVCNYVHEGDAPPETCPICGVGAEEFVLLTEDAATVSKMNALPKSKGKRWKCTVCDYVHEGETPPDVCPWCGVGPDKFILLDGEAKALDDEVIASATAESAVAVTDSISYGLYILTAHDGDKINGQCVNTLIQLTVTPLQVMVSVNNNNLTASFIKKTGTFAAMLLSREHMDLVRIFGYQSGKKANKFEKVPYILGKNGCPIPKTCLGYLECDVVQTIDVGTHSIFVGKVTAGSMVEEAKALTYDFFREQNKKK